MKLTAILVPASFVTLFPMLTYISFAIYQAVRKKDPSALYTPVRQARKRLLLIFGFGYILALLSSLCWASYVFIGKPFYAVAFGACAFIATAILFLMSKPFSTTEQPSEADMYKQLDKRMETLSKKWLIVFLTLMALGVVWAIAAVIIVALTNH